MFTQEMIEKAKLAKSAEELLALAQANGLEMNAQEAGLYFAQLNQAAGEISDEELDDVAGGACHGSTDGKTYTVVTNGKKCFNGLYARGIELCGDGVYTVFHNQSNKSLRETWATMAFNAPDCCGTCYDLEFDGSIGYCKYTLK